VELPPTVSSVEYGYSDGAAERAVNTSFERGEKPVPTAADQTKEAAEPKAPAAPPPPVDEKGPADVVRTGFAAEKPEGTLAYFKGRNLVNTSFVQAVKRAIERNLAIRFADKGLERASASVEKAKAAFDPVFTLSINGTQNDTYERREFVFRRRFIAGELQNEITDAIAGAPEAPVQDAGAFTGLVQDDVITVIPAVDGFAMRGAFERSSLRARSRIETLTAGFSEQLPYGAIFNMSLASKHNKTLFSESADEDSFTVTDTLPDGTERQRSVFYEIHSRSTRPPMRSWSSILSVRLTVPVPYTKDWGPYGPAHISGKLAKVGHEQAYWQLQSAVNDTLLNINAAYWDLVRAVRRLEAVSATRKSLEQTATLTEDMLKAGKVTNYALLQAKTSLVSVQVQEQGAWAGYIKASNFLNNLLDQNRETVLLPVNYAGDLAGGISLQTADALTMAIENNPNLMVSRMDLEAARIGVKFAQNQLRPDMKLTTGMDWVQGDSTYGYSNIGASLADLASPDARSGFVALNYRVPWGNKPAEERRKQADQRYQESEKGLRSQIDAVVESVRTAVTDMASQREQAAIALQNMQTAERVLKYVRDLWEQGRVLDADLGKNTPEFAVLNKTSDLLFARLAYIDTQASLKQAEGRLLAAQGLIAARYMQDFKIDVAPVKDAPKTVQGQAAAEKKDAKRDEPAK
jgi:outer membrane protein TolC